ncbi:pyridoxamine 5'-phosphate oxidase [Niastella vici]|uniref:Pyridoxamine 5'-phosphate oxidase n=1 Tax=Niastella vici TaxID=1703345 RepID=A0A1V9FZM6_9BACT|nr:pyridoxamine 5'-phosphate oxidase family protein [Niastella vici]OQP63819.1 pyridoxamine 5'-phosphate oxidase [Niastella vici]
MLGSLDNKQIEDVLMQQIMGRIGCCGDGITYIVPISYAYDGVYVYGHTTEGMKIDILRQNTDVCFEVEEMKDMANWKSVIAWGKFEELTDQTQRTIGLQKLVDRVLPLISSETTHLSPQWPFPMSDINTIKGIVFRIRLEKKTGRFETNVVISFMGFG